MPYTSFAVAGATGGDTPFSASLGLLISKELLAKGAKVTVLSRAGSVDKPSAAELKSLGATIAVVDYEDEASLVQALNGIEVVISAVATSAIPAQKVLADAAKAAGVKVFAPSEFGLDTTVVSSESPLYGKRLIQEHLRSIGLPSVLFFTGPFVHSVPRFFRANEAKEIEVIGEGKTENFSTSVPDVARYVAHVFTSAPDSAIFNKSLYLGGTRGSLLPVAQKLQAATPGSKIVHVDPATARQRWTEKYDFVSWLLAELDSGSAAWKEEDVAYSRSLFPDWNPKGLD